ncbi:MAG: amidohydrolase [Blastocatellia bacterium]|nr:amidohydrolase [Blastocatellia bacterium]MCS7157886.1 amidohydrolase [Blastocatellia bacterium]MCX7753377.1 amidohydrolase [Blastocatellia bacterium]MDW8168036.1 amidohydrolase [Acidobacteriota bacterium]MDW8257715.1 amidohydrolase [Acidobacteriota bacterium]
MMPKTWVKRILVLSIGVASLWPGDARMDLRAIQRGSASPAQIEAYKQELLATVEGMRKLTQVMVDMIFSFAELGFQEFETSRYVTEILEREGFRVERGVAGIPTAWVASWGRGRPVIGFIADIDAIPGASQKPGVAYHDPIVEGAPGHGEGHNAGQAVIVTAALALKSLMERHQLAGTLRLYPGVAEELLGSKNYFVRAGLFKDVDIVLGAHISDGFSTAYGVTNTGLVSTQFTFRGEAAHSAGAPWRGRSALDAVELMNVAWNFRREHLRPQHRSHYVIVEGGDQPNVVPDRATVWYYFRETDYARIKHLHEIGQRIARAAALMTDTEVTERILAATWPTHFNKVVAEVLQKNIERVGMPAWSEADQMLAKALQKEIGADPIGLRTEVGRLEAGGDVMRAGSDDIGEISWNVPTVYLRFPGNIPGLPGHHWANAVSMATPIAHKGATAGAKAIALTALDFLMQPELVQAAWAYFREQTKEQSWVSLIPEGTPPPIHLNREKMERFRPLLERFRFNPEKYDTYLDQLGIRYPTIRPGR